MLLVLWLACTSAPPSDSGEPSDSAIDTSSDDSGDTDDTGDTDEDGPSYLAVAAGNDHTCWLSRASEGAPVEVTCVGRSTERQRDVPAAGDWTDLVAAGATTCAMAPSTVVCWGDDPTLPESLAGVPPTVVGGVSLSPTVGCGLDVDGGLVCWGDDSLGQATPPTTPTTWQQTAPGSRHSCARTSGQVRCWGDGTQGQLLAPSGQFRDLASGARHACAVGSDASLSCWGDNRYGQARPPLNELFRAVALGPDFSCALRTDDFPRCFGRNEHGQTVAPENTPLELLATGTRHSCGVTLTGELTCWGYAPAWAP